MTATEPVYRPMPRLRTAMQQTCKMCGQPDKFNFYVPDKIWKLVVPPEFQTLAVCLYCFDEQAATKGVDFAASISELCFAGRAANLNLAVS